MLGVIQTFDPTGVGARNLAECLALQAKEADRYDPAMARLIDNLDLLARGAIAQLRRICGVDDEDMADMIRELRDYDPKPGCAIGGEPAQAVVPDIFVARRKDGWGIEINAATLPRAARQPQLLCRAVGRPAATRRARPGCPNASPAPTGWSRRSTSASARSSRSRPRS